MASAIGFGEVPVHAAAQTGNAEVVGPLIEEGADFEGRRRQIRFHPLAFAR